MSKSQFKVKLFLFILFLIGIAIIALVLLDAHVFRWYLKPPRSLRGVTDANLEALRPHVVLVVTDFGDGNPINGTGFVISPGYIATNRHVVCQTDESDPQKVIFKNSSATVQVIDHDGNMYPATILKACQNPGDGQDMAILTIANKDLPAVPMVNSDDYKKGHGSESVFAVGYPLVGVSAGETEAQFSADGKLGVYQEKQDLFSCNLTVNPGNSGGPVFVKNGNKVFGVAVAKMVRQDVDAVSFVIPINNFKKFFREAAGQTLP